MRKLLQFDIMKISMLEKVSSRRRAIAWSFKLTLEMTDHYIDSYMLGQFISFPVVIITLAHDRSRSNHKVAIYLMRAISEDDSCY